MMTLFSLRHDISRLPIALALACVSAVAGTINVQWIGPTGTGGSGDWSTAANWSGGVVPNNSGGNTYNVTLPPSSSCPNLFCYTVTLDTSPTIDSLTLEPGAGLFTSLPPETLTITGSLTNAGDIVIGGTIVAAKISNTGILGFGPELSAPGQIIAGQYIQTASPKNTRTVTSFGVNATMNVPDVIISGGGLGFADDTLATHDTVNGNLTIDGGSFFADTGVINGNLTLSATGSYTGGVFFPCPRPNCLPPLSVSGDASLSGTLNLSLNPFYGFASTFEVMTYHSETGQFSNVNVPGTPATTVTLDYQPTVLKGVIHGPIPGTPEPASWLLMATGFVGLLIHAKWRYPNRQSRRRT
jgi:hypothetical protein